MGKRLVAFFVLLLTVPAQATTYIVDTSGADGGAGTFGDPWSLHKACTANAVVAGDIIQIRSGTYTEELCNFGSHDYIMCIEQSGTAGNPITWRNYPGEARPIIRGDTLFAALTSGIELSGTQYLVFDSIRITNCYLRGFQIESASNYEIRNCQIDTIGLAKGGNNPGGLSAAVGQTDSGYVHDNTFILCWSAGITMECGVDSFAIIDNTFINCEMALLLKLSIVGLHATNVRFQNNKVYREDSGGRFGEYGLLLPASYKAIDIDISGNYFYGPISSGVWIRFGTTDAGQDTARHDRFLIYNNTFDCENQTHGFLSIELADTLNAVAPQDSTFLFDTVQVFNNIVYTPDPTGGSGSDPGLYAFFGKMTYESAGTKNGVGRVGPGFMLDYNGIIDTSGADMVYWHQADSTAGGWVTGSARTWTHQEFVDSMPLFGTLSGNGANDTIVTSVSNIFTDIGARDYTLHASAPAYLTGGGRGGLYPTYLGAFEPVVADTNRNVIGVVDGEQRHLEYPDCARGHHGRNANFHRYLFSDDWSLR